MTRGQKVIVILAFIFANKSKWSKMHKNHLRQNPKSTTVLLPKNSSILQDLMTFCQIGYSNKHFIKIKSILTFFDHFPPSWITFNDVEVINNIPTRQIKHSRPLSAVKNLHLMHNYDGRGRTSVLSHPISRISFLDFKSERQLKFKKKLRA